MKGATATHALWFACCLDTALASPELYIRQDYAFLLGCAFHASRSQLPWAG